VTWITGTLREDLCKFVISRWILRRVRNVSDKNFRENLNTHFVFNNFFPKIVSFMRECRKLWYSCTGHRWRHNMAHALCTLRICNTRVAFPPRQLIHESASMLRYTYIDCFVTGIYGTEELYEWKSSFAERKHEAFYESKKSTVRKNSKRNPQLNAIKMEQ
jgi:hypothetical protein